MALASRRFPNSKRSPRRCEPPAARSRRRRHAWCRQQSPRTITASAAATSGPRRAGRPRRRPPTKGSPPRWLGSTTPPTQRGWPRDAATRPGGPSRRCFAQPANAPVAMSRPGRIGASARGVRLGWRLARIRALVRRRRLDAALAHGADPWSAGELVVRAAQLGSLAERRKVAAGLISLLDLAAFQRRRSSSLTWCDISWCSSTESRCARSPSASPGSSPSMSPSSRNSSSS